MVECDLAKVDVEGSNPFRRSILLRQQLSIDRWLRRNYERIENCCEAIVLLAGVCEAESSFAQSFSPPKGGSANFCGGSFELRRDLQLQDCCRFYEAIDSRRVEGEVDPSAAPIFACYLRIVKLILRRKINHVNLRG